MVKELEEVEDSINDGATIRSRYVSEETTDVALQSYHKQVMRRIQEEGERNFPMADGRELYGQVYILLTLSANGRLEKTEILKSTSENLSGYLSDLLRRLEPYQPFPAEIRNKADQLVLRVAIGYVPR